jgi:ComF family protein
MPNPVHRLASAIRVLGADLLDLLAPRECVACLELHPAHPPAPRTPALCALCAATLAPAEDPPRDVIVPFAHGGPLADAIHRAKYGDDPFFASALGSLLAHAIARDERIASADIVLGVPLHRRRLAARGFNQAVEMARHLGKPLVFGAIERVRDTPSQVGLDRSERARNVRAAFALVDARRLRDRHVLIVDDVVTTGATLAEVSAAARAAGARRVTSVALVRAPLDRVR